MISALALLCIAWMIYSLVRSFEKLRTFLYGVLAIVGTTAIVWLPIWAFSLHEVMMAYAASMLIFVIPACVMWTHARSTRKLATVKPDGGAC